MSFFNKIAEHKGIAIAGTVAAVVALGGLLAYKSYQNQDKYDDFVAEDNGLDLEKQLKGLRKQVNTANPSFEDIKEILRFSMNYSKKKIFNYSRQFKKRRQQYNKKNRKQHMSEYLNLVSNGMEEVRNLATNSQAEIMKELGLDESVFIKYQNQLGMFMQELMMQQAKPVQGIKQVTLEELKYAIRLQAEYLKTQGEEMVDQLLQATKNWPAAKKSELPLIISVIIADGAFQDHPQIDEEAIQAAQMQMQHHIIAEMQELQQAIAPLMKKISAHIGGGMGMGGMEMGMGMGMGMDDMDPYGGLSMEQMQQLQKLEQMRMQDPAAFEEMMKNMYG